MTLKYLFLYRLRSSPALFPLHLALHLWIPFPALIRVLEPLCVEALFHEELHPSIHVFGCQPKKLYSCGCRSSAKSVYEHNNIIRHVCVLSACVIFMFVLYLHESKDRVCTCSRHISMVTDRSAC